MASVQPPGRFASTAHAAPETVLATERRQRNFSPLIAECLKPEPCATTLKYAVGIDVRLNEVSCLLVDERGGIRASVSAYYDNAEPQGVGWSEQNPGDWWTAAVRALRFITARADTDKLVAVGLSGQPHGLVALDVNNDVVRNAILMSDERSATEYNVVVREEGVDAIATPKKRAFYPHFVESKLLWLRRNEPENYARIAKFIMPKDYVRYKLTGIVATSAADAEKSGFFHTESRQWDSSIVAGVGYDIVDFPQIVPSNAPCGTVTQEASRETGLPAGLPVYGEAEDIVLEYAGMSLLRGDVLGIVLGTSGIAAVQTHDIPSVANGRLESKMSFDGSTYMLYGQELSCMDSVQWVRDALYADVEDADTVLERAALRAPVGAHGVVFLPYLMGERSPRVEPDAKAVFYGLSVHTGGRDLVRSVMEGIVFGLEDIYTLIRSSNRHVDCHEIVLAGEGCRFHVLRRIVADVFDMPVKVYEGAAEGTAYGAALVAGVGERMFSSMAQAEAVHRVEEVVEPNGENTEHYRHCLRVYRELCADLRRTFTET